MARDLLPLTLLFVLGGAAGASPAREGHRIALDRVGIVADPGQPAHMRHALKDLRGYLHELGGTVTRARSAADWRWEDLAACTPTDDGRHAVAPVTVDRLRITNLLDLFEVEVRCVRVLPWSRGAAESIMPLMIRGEARGMEQDAGPGSPPYHLGPTGLTPLL